MLGFHSVAYTGGYPSRGALAQSVEQLTFNQLVEGSNPSRPTTNNFNDLATILLDMKPHL